MIHLRSKTDCAGCGGCRQICPTDCISYQPDAEGFFYPVIDENRCIRCGKCETVCPMLVARPQEFTPEAFACKNQNRSVRQSSSSGGVFTALAAQCLREGGVVFGAALQPNGQVEHIAVITEDELSRLRGSKYVQSNMGDCFQKAKAFLEEGRFVLFSGTPCQLYGLSCFLGKTYENLLTVDTVCMGVPSPGVWNSYRLAREKSVGGHLIAAHFRDKRSGWKNYSMHLAFENGAEYSALRLKDPYLSCFLKRLDLRPSCHDCRFKGTARQSDLTLGDYWGIESLYPDWDDEQGISLVLVNTPNGSHWFTRSSHELEFRSAPLEHAIKTHPSLVCSMEANPKRAAFFAAIEQKKDILPILTRYGSPTIVETIRSIAGKLLRKLGLRKSG